VKASVQSVDSMISSSLNVGMMIDHPGSRVLGAHQTDDTHLRCLVAPAKALWHPHTSFLAGRFRTSPAVFAVFAGNYQRQSGPSAQEPSIAGGVANERTAG
jgi:hypothetical protein